MIERLKKNHLWAYTLVLPVYLICFYTVEYFVTDNYHVMYMPLDDKIPFCEWFSLPYILWMPMLIAAALYLLYNDTAGYKLYMTYVGISFFSTLLIYVIYPNGQELRVTSFENPNLLTDFVQYLYSCDTNTNVCPSLHVIGSFAAVFGVFHSKKLRSAALKFIIIVSAAIIALSTVFIKQHSVVDVFAGIALSAAVWVIVYWRVSPLRKRLEGSVKEE